MHTLNGLCAYVDWEALLPCFKAWIMMCHRNCEVLSNALGRETPRLWLEPRRGGIRC